MYIASLNCHMCVRGVIIKCTCKTHIAVLIINHIQWWWAMTGKAASCLGSWLSRGPPSGPQMPTGGISLWT